MAKMFRTEYQGMQQGVPLMRASYAFNMQTAREQKKDDGTTKLEYGCTLIIPRSNEAGLRKLQAMVAEVVKGEWGDKGVERFKQGLIKNPILPGDGKEARDKTSGDINPGLGPEFVFIRAKSNDPVKVFNAKVLPAAKDEIVSGYWGYPVLNAYAWHNPKNGDGVTFGISMFQFTKVDDILGSGGPSDPGAYFETVQTEGGGDVTGGAGAGGMFD